MTEQDDDTPIFEILDKDQVTMGVDPDTGFVILEAKQGDEEHKGFIILPSFAEAIGNELFKLAQEGRAIMERKAAQDG